MSDEIAHLSRRANQEYVAAAHATHPSAVASHMLLAALYADRLRIAMIGSALVPPAGRDLPASPDRPVAVLRLLVPHGR